MYKEKYVKMIKNTFCMKYLLNQNRQILLINLLGSLIIFNIGFAQVQHPSPMVDYSRAHERVEKTEFSGIQISIEGLLPKPIQVFFSEHSLNSDSLKLMFHFHGSSFVPLYAIETSQKPYILANINLGHGSSAYEKPFLEHDVFPKIINAIVDSVATMRCEIAKFEKIYLTSFSAGYGAIRAILKNKESFDSINGIILLDGLHTDYVPESKVLAEGGTLNTDKLKHYLEFAKLAIAKEKIFVVVHSEIFPGSYASTTETADYLIRETGLSRKSVLNWGVLGMQQLSEVKKGNFNIKGFAGNSAPDHIDIFHALFDFIKYLD